MGASRFIALAALLLVACLDHDLADDASVPDVFIPQQRDFRDFREWMRFELRTAVGHAGVSGPVFAYLNELPPRDATEFPVGTIIVKTVEIGPATEWNVHAMVKRGGGFNDQGAYNWEFCDLAINDDDVPVIMWCAEEPPSDHGYESLLNAGGDATPDADCNSCHNNADADFVRSAALALDELR